MEVTIESIGSKEGTGGAADVVAKRREVWPMKIWLRIVDGQLVMTSKTPMNISFSSRLKTLERNVSSFIVMSPSLCIFVSSSD